MNKVVREHYPASKLPQDLREGLDEQATVRVVVEVEDIPPLYDDTLSGFAADMDARPRSMTAREAIDAMAEYRKTNIRRVPVEETVARIRELRDEWED